MTTPYGTFADIPLTCYPEAIAPEDRAAHQETTQTLFAAILEIKELADGFAIRLPVDAATLQLAAQYIVNERLCCPFLQFDLTITPGGHAVWLRLSGGEGVKAMLAEQISQPGTQEGKSGGLAT